MANTIHFEHVSKQYKLGLTRTSLPAVVSGWFKKIGKNPQRSLSRQSDFWALRDVSFDLNQGQSLALIGANGAGKTTILKLLAHITRPTSGSISTAGRLSALIELGAGFHPDLTGRENIYLNGTILGLSRKQIDSNFEEIVAFSELEEFINTPVKRYSSGMAVRLGFAVASCIKPEILLVDEVLAVGDASFQQKCMDRIQSLLNIGTSILFVSHNLYLVKAICNIGLYLSKGQIAFYGKIDDSIKAYETAIHEQRALRFEMKPYEKHEDQIESEIEVTQVEIQSICEPSSNILHSNQPLKIRIHFTAYQSMGQVQVSVFIKRSDGLTCCMMRSKLDNFKLIIDRGKGIIDVDMDPVQLIGGTYYAEAWFLDGADSMVIVSRPGQSEWFSVRGKSLTYDNNSGVFEPNSRWSQEKLKKSTI